MEAQPGDAVAVLPALGGFDGVWKSVGGPVGKDVEGAYRGGAGVDASNLARNHDSCAIKGLVRGVDFLELASRIIHQVFAALRQGLKPVVLARHSARLKSCPDTKRVLETGSRSLELNPRGSPTNREDSWTMDAEA